MILPKEFYERDTSKVARELLDKLLVRRLKETRMEAAIVETEAYYGEDDPASRAYNGVKNYNSVMWGEPGRLFIYNVHRYWMLNIIAHETGEVGGVLIRAVEPLKGIDRMLMNRPVEDVRELTNGPGKLSVALAVAKELNGTDVTSEEAEVFVLDSDLEPEIAASHRIGVREDLKEELRFYIVGNEFVSR